MDLNQRTGDPIEAVAQLEEPNRRRLYDLVVGSPEAVGRDAAAAALQMSRELAAFHLDRLVEVGLLDVEFRRLGGRTGPGAGRPAKLYKRTERDVSVSLPARHYERAADLMATALERAGPESTATVISIARERGAPVLAAGVHRGPHAVREGDAQVTSLGRR